MLGFLRRLLDTFGEHEKSFGQFRLPGCRPGSDRLVGVALTVISQEARGGQEAPPVK